MIIRDGRIRAAGCLLPLTEDRTLSTELGTRHRAAIGLSEQTDAVVVVVSEETGTISYTYGVIFIAIYQRIKLKRHCAPLWNALKPLVCGNGGQINDDSFESNWPAKLLSLLQLSLCGSLSCDQNPVMEVTYTIPVQVQNLNSGYIIEDAPDAVVRVVLAGPRDTIIMSMKSDNLRAYIDASGVNQVKIM